MWWINLKNKLFGWQYILLDMSGGDIVTRRAICKKNKLTGECEWVARAIVMICRLQPRGSVLDVPYCRAWNPITSGIREFYESEPPPTQSPMPTTEEALIALSRVIIPTNDTEEQINREKEISKNNKVYGRILTGKRDIDIG